MKLEIGGGGVMTLTIVFVLLKAFDKIDWSWWWVFSPLWIAIILTLLIIAIILIVVVITT